MMRKSVTYKSLSYDKDSGEVARSKTVMRIEKEMVSGVLAGTEAFDFLLGILTLTQASIYLLLAAHSVQRKGKWMLLLGDDEKNEISNVLDVSRVTVNRSIAKMVHLELFVHENRNSNVYFYHDSLPEKLKPRYYDAESKGVKTKRVRALQRKG